MNPERALKIIPDYSSAHGLHFLQKNPGSDPHPISKNNSRGGYPSAKDRHLPDFLLRSLALARSAAKKEESGYYLSDDDCLRIRTCPAVKRRRVYLPGTAEAAGRDPVR